MRYWPSTGMPIVACGFDWLFLSVRLSSSRAPSSGARKASRDGGTGRRSGLKIRRPLRPWGFDPPSRHQSALLIARGFRAGHNDLNAEIFQGLEICRRSSGISDERRQICDGSYIGKALLAKFAV